MKHVWTISCFGFMIFHLIHLTAHYLEYEFHSEFRIINEIPSKSVAISMCKPFFALWYTVASWDHAYRNNPLYDIAVHTEKLLHPTIKGISFEGSNFTNNFTIDDYFVYDMSLCFRIKIPTKKTPQRHIFSFKSAWKPKGFYILYYNYVHDSDIYPRGLISAYSKIFIIGNTLHRHLIDLYETKYLPPPYEHKCTKYEKNSKNPTSSAHCFEKCVDSYRLNNSPNKTGFHSSFTMEELKQPHNRFRQYDDLYNFPNITLNSKCFPKLSD